jgi:protein-disulfide isomerase
MADDITDPVLRERVEQYLQHPVEHRLGNPDARTCVVEFGDFECPYCAGAAPVLRELVESSEGQVRLIYRNFPLFEVHPHALTAALAAESVAASAGEEAYWHMHDKLFAHQARLIDPDLQLYAKSLGGDPDLATGTAAQRFAPIVQADYAAGIEAGVSGTPTLFIDGQAYDGVVEVGALRHATGLTTEAAPTKRRLFQRR